jgi:hypothetical protein
LPETLVTKQKAGEIRPSVLGLKIGLDGLAAADF